MSTTPSPSVASTSATSFELVDSLVAVPSSTRKKVVTLGAKVLLTKKEKRKILPEEKYVANLEKLITRDYFPDLPKLKAQAEFMEAVASNDHVKIRELQIRYCTRRRTSPRTSLTAATGLSRPGTSMSTTTNVGGSSGLVAPSPSVFDPDTPRQPFDEEEAPYANKDGDNEAALRQKKRKSALDQLTVQSYLDRYTSEDNASFEELAEIHNKRERVRNAWMYEAEERHNRELVYVAPPLPLAADEQLLAVKGGAEVEKPRQNDNWEYKARNAVLFHPEDAPLTMEEFMQRTKQNEKVINKEATRFKYSPVQNPNQAVMARAAFQQAGLNAGRVDISGKDVGVVKHSTLGLVATPSPMPGVDESPLMTWGEIEGTPFRLDAPDIPPAIGDAPAFKIPEVPVRERVAQDIAEQIAQRYHGKRKHAMEQVEKLAPKTPKFGSTRGSEKFGALSPAARRLATDKLGIRIGTDKLIKMSPRTPSSQRSTLYSPAIHKLMKAVKKEPVSKPPTPNTPSTASEKANAGPQSSSSVTDNLFVLPPSPLQSEDGDDGEEGFMRERERGQTRGFESNRPSAKDFF